MKKFILLLTLTFFLSGEAHANLLTDWWSGLWGKKEVVIEEGTVIKQINDNNTNIEGDTIENIVENQTTVQGDLVTNQVEAEVNNNVEIGETRVSNEVNVPDQITISPNPLRIQNIDPVPQPFKIENVIPIPQPFDVIVSEFKQTLNIASQTEFPALEALQSLVEKLTEILNRMQTRDEGESARIEAAILAGISSENPHFEAEVLEVVLREIEFETFQTVIERATVFFEDEDSVELKKKSQNLNYNLIT